MTRRDIITGEYPPQHGGVADHTRTVAAALARAGDDVHVWCGGAAPSATVDGGVHVHRSLGAFAGPALAEADAGLDAAPHPRGLLVQWVPQAYGHRSINLRFCRWLEGRARRGDTLDVIVHEPYLPFAGGLRQRAASVIQQRMLAAVLRGASRVWVTTPAWEPLCRASAPRAAIRWLPVPSGIPLAEPAPPTAGLRARLGLPPDAPLITSFGRGGGGHAGVIRRTLRDVRAAGHGAHVLLVGIGSEAIRGDILASEPALESWLHATGPIDETAVSRLLRVSDVALQPYQDGVCGRRSSVMACLLHGVPTITTDGRFTESIWREGGVRLLPDGASAAQDVLRLLGDRDARSSLGCAGRDLYDRHFAVPHVVAALQGSRVSA